MAKTVIHRLCETCGMYMPKTLELCPSRSCIRKRLTTDLLLYKIMFDGSFPA